MRARLEHHLRGIPLHDALVETHGSRMRDELRYRGLLDGWTAGLLAGSTLCPLTPTLSPRERVFMARGQRLNPLLEERVAERVRWRRALRHCPLSPVPCPLSLAREQQREKEIGHDANRHRHADRAQ